jgi:hypothetical protein
MVYVQQNNEREINYFVPRQFMLLVEHEQRLAPTEISHLIKCNRIFASTDLLSRAFINPERVLTFERSNRRRESSYFSLVFADIDVDNEELISLVDTLDRQLTRGKNRASGDELALRIASPNWLCSGAGSRQVGTGGPGAKPVPPSQASGEQLANKQPSQRPTFRFNFDNQGKFNGTRPKHDVEVVILDTAPSEQALKNAFDTWHQQHPLLDTLLGPNGVVPNYRLRISYADPLLMAALNDPIDGYEISGHDYKMTDHGLFVAGIIHTIAPHSKLHIVQVLNDFGVGTVESIAHGFYQIIQQKSVSSSGKRTHVIVNCSLTINIPCGDYAQDNMPWERLKSDTRFLQLMGLPIEWICDALRDQEVLVVAAAGNDASSTNRPPARFPAAFGSVIGVGALEHGSDPAYYSNLSDRPPKKGIATFGGAATSNGDTDPEHGILGVYIGDFPDKTPNQYGWARWAGTSFAAPIVTGVLAVLRGDDVGSKDAVDAIYATNPDMTPLPGEEEILYVEQIP